MTTYERAVSPNERIYFAGARLAPPFAIQIVVEGRGGVDVDALRRAVATSSDACPGSRLVRRGRQWVDAGEAPLVREVACQPGVAFEDAPFLRDPIGPDGGATCEVLVVDGMTLVFRAFHGVMDGKGALTWVRDVFRALRSEALAGAPSNETDLALVRRLGTPARRPPLHFEHPSPLGVTGVDDTRYLWKRRTLYGAHAGLVAKVAAILAARSEGEHARFLVPVDLRRHDASLRSTANLSLPILLDVPRGETWEAIHARLVGHLAERAELALDGSEGAVGAMPVWGLLAGVRIALRKQRRSGRYLASGILSHLGRVDVRDFSTSSFVATSVHSLPVHAPLAPLSIVAVEHGDRVELTLACPEGDGMSARAVALLDAVEDELAQGDMRRWPGNRTAAPYRSGTTLAQLFAEQAAKTPDAVALVRCTVRVTYSELWQRSQEIAKALASLGVGPGDIVGLVAERNEDAIAALLGVMSTGAAYLPIDPSYPDERVRYMLADAGVRHCLVQTTLAPRVATCFDGETLVLGALTGDGMATHANAAAAGDVAYVIYTSGSSGRPKGVAVEHRQLVNYVEWAICAYGVDTSSRFALFTSLSFDLSITSIFVPLLAGGSVALFPEELDHVTLRRVLEESGVNALKLTPTHLALIARLGFAPRGIRTVVVGGEQLRGSTAANAQRAFGDGCRIVNEYGPTETTVGCVTCVFDARRDGESAAVPIGVPASNVRIYLLDAERRAVPPGEAGEIYIAGDGVARGYLGKPELTRERFVPLFGTERAYRTGDLARLRDDGFLEFLGRSDEQIKIRGHRIEPGEIEAVLEQHPLVDRAVVLGRARPGEGGEKILCAYVVPRAGLDDDELRAFLDARLPSPLVPASITRVVDIPLTTNGKVDVRALPDSAWSAEPHRVSEREDVSDVARVWAAILGVDAARLAPSDDFHRLGGDSLRMVEMLAMVAKQIVGSDGESAFMQSAPAIIRRPTLDVVSRAAEKARRKGGFDEHPPA